MQYWNNEEERLAQWQLAEAELPSDVAEELAWLRDDPGMDSPSVQIDADGMWRLITDDTHAWKKTLVFHDVTTCGDGDFETIRSAELTKTENGYLLELLGACEDEQENNYQITFSGATVETEFYDYTRRVALGNNCPWESVGWALWWLSSKAQQFGAGVLNEQEQALLPLAELQAVFRFADESIHITAEGAGVFARYARAAGLEKLAITVERMAGQVPQKHAGRRVRRLRNFLEGKECECLWRDIAAVLKSAAAAYPVKYADCVDKKALDRERKNITKAIRSQGFQGNYPNFFRRSNLRGIHLRSVKGITQFVGFGKSMDSYIHCAEHYDSEGRIIVDYITSTICFQKDDTAQTAKTDAYSGFFTDKNRRFGTAFAPALPKGKDGTFVYPDNKEVALLAVKTAQLRKLTKSEHEKILGGADNTSAFGLLFVTALFSSAVFGAIMMIGMGLVSISVGGIIILLTGRDISLLFGLITGLPWLKLFLLTGGGFGAIMLVVTAASQVRSLNR